MLKIALKGETVLTFRDWLRMQYLLVNRLYVRTWIKMFERRPPYMAVNLTPNKYNPIENEAV